MLKGKVLGTFFSKRKNDINNNESELISRIFHNVNKKTDK